MKRYTALVLLATFIVSGCFRMQLDTISLDRSVYLSSSSPKAYTRLKEFTVNTKGSWAIFGLVTLSKPDLSELIKEEISRQNGDAIINLTIKTQTTFGDGFFTVIALLGLIYHPRTVIISGTVVSFNKESSLRSVESINLVCIQNAFETEYRAHGFVDENTELNF
ncbi:MAG: hypothetical protein WDA22_16335 [Bacteroidota bacterium]